MWSRVIEFMLGCWLAISPFIFTLEPQQSGIWYLDWIYAVLVILFALLSYWKPLRHIHLATGLLALAMIGYGRFAVESPISPALQNHIITGLLLLMFSLVPNRASHPPRVWYEQLPGSV
tara:strand:+ start:4072 stop:4428 length:357 start_codon:yes stop_codon:yes gene_type:complete